MLGKQLCHQLKGPAFLIRAGQNHQERCLHKEGTGRIFDAYELTVRFTLMADFEMNSCSTQRTN